jgi:hypothetical protein
MTEQDQTIESKILNLRSVFETVESEHDNLNRFLYNHSQVFEPLLAIREKYLSFLTKESLPGLSLRYQKSVETGDQYVLVFTKFPFSFQNSDPLISFLAWWANYSIDANGLIRVFPYSGSCSQEGIEEKIGTLVFDFRELDQNFSYKGYNGQVSFGRDAVFDWLYRHLYTIPFLFELKRRAKEGISSFLNVHLSVHIDPECGNIPSQLVADIAIRTNEQTEVADVLVELHRLQESFYDDPAWRDVIIDIKFVQDIQSSWIVFIIDLEARPEDGLKLYRIKKAMVGEEATTLKKKQAEGLSVWTVPDEEKVEPWMLREWFPSQWAAESALKELGGKSASFSGCEGVYNHITVGSEWFEFNKDWLLENYYEKWICLYGDVLLGIFDTSSQAYKHAVSTANSDRVYVTQLVEDEKKIVHIYNLAL